MNNFIGAILLTLCCSNAWANPIEDLLKEVSSYDKKLDASVVAVRIENEKLEKKYIEAVEHTEKFKQSLDAKIRDKVDIGVIKSEVLEQKNKALSSIKIDDNLIRAYKGKISDFAKEISDLKKEYQEYTGKPDYQKFLVEKAKKRISTFHMENREWEVLLRYYQEDTKNFRLTRFENLQKEAASYGKLLGSFLHQDEICKRGQQSAGNDIKSKDFIFTKNVNFQDPVLWNFVLARENKTLTVECKEVRFGSPSISYDSNKHQVTYTHKYSVSLVGMNETSVPEKTPWTLIYEEAKKWGTGDSKPKVVAPKTEDFQESYR